MKSNKYILIIMTIFTAFLFLLISYVLFIYKPHQLKIYIPYKATPPNYQSEILYPIAQNKILPPYFEDLEILEQIKSSNLPPIIGILKKNKLLSTTEHAPFPLIKSNYQRFYNLSHYSLPTNFLHKIELENKFIRPWLITEDIIVPEPIYQNPYTYYKSQFIISDLEKALAIIQQKYPIMTPSIQDFFEAESFYPDHIFITKKEIFENYINWLLSILYPLYEDIKQDIVLRPQNQQTFVPLFPMLFTIYIRFVSQNYGIKIKEFPEVIL